MSKPESKKSEKNEKPEAAHRPLYGVNLGGWLMLEKWITPSLFPDGVKDEYSLYQSANATVRKKLTKHFETFITRADFIWLKSHGVEVVRIPVNHAVFGDEESYIKTVEYLDKAFDWSDETGVRILLDLHTVPGSQNGRQESGRIGPIGWHRDEKNIIRSLQVVRKLAKRYGQCDCLLGIELLNEPSYKIPRQVLLRYYEAGYRLVRNECGPDTWVVFHDTFRYRRWKRKLRRPRFGSMFIDTHQYQCFSPWDKRLRVASHLKKTLKRLSRTLAKMAKRHPMIVGEWSMALDARSLRGLTDSQKQAAYRAYGAAQQVAYDSADAWFYWTYRTESSGAWNFRDCIEKGLLTIPKTK